MGTDAGPVAWPAALDHMPPTDEPARGTGESPRPTAADFDSLYRQVAPALFAWAELRIRPEMRSRVDPQDLVQEVWLRAVKRFATFDGTLETFRPWVLTIAKNVLLESFRKLRNGPRLEADIGPTTRMLVIEGCPELITSFTKRLAKDDAVRRFLELAGALDEIDRQVLVRCGLEGRPAADVAREIEMSEDAVAKRWQRLRARLRQETWVEAILSP